MSLPANFKLEGWNFTLVEPTWGVNEFPDGQIQFWMNSKPEIRDLTLTCSIFTSRDLDLFIQIINTIKLHTVRIKYWYGARCDKSKADNLIVANLPKMLAEIIDHSKNPSWHTKYKVWNPHCTLSESFKVEIPLPLELSSHNYDAIIYPDASAYKRMHHLFDDYPSLVASKVRDQVTGKITSYQLPTISIIDIRFYLVVDDICDGGATFINLIDKMPTDLCDVDLYITHGLFSKGVDHLKSRYRNIWCTDSCPGHLLLNGEHGTY